MDGEVATTTSELVYWLLLCYFGGWLAKVVRDGEKDYQVVPSS